LFLPFSSQEKGPGDELGGFEKMKPTWESSLIGDPPAKGEAQSFCLSFFCLGFCF
jgi:hypothetical protein